MEPVTVMEPTQNSSVAEIRPSAMDTSFPFLLNLPSTFSARVLMPPSIFSRVPLIAPSTTEAMRMSTFSPLRLPVIPIYMVQAPRPVIAALLTLSGMPFLNSRPMDEPIITVITFIITPSILPILSPYISVWGA